MALDLSVNVHTCMGLTERITASERVLKRCVGINDSVLLDDIIACFGFVKETVYLLFCHGCFIIYTTQLISNLDAFLMWNFKV